MVRKKNQSRSYLNHLVYYDARTHECQTGHLSDTRSDYSMLKANRCSKNVKISSDAPQLRTYQCSNEIGLLTIIQSPYYGVLQVCRHPVTISDI